MRQAVNRTQRHSRTAPPRQWWPDPPRTATKPPALSLLSSLLPHPPHPKSADLPHRCFSLPITSGDLPNNPTPSIQRSIEACKRMCGAYETASAVSSPSVRVSHGPPPSSPASPRPRPQRATFRHPASIPHQSPFLPMSACGDVNSSPNSDPSTAGGGGGELAGRGRRGACQWGSR